MPKPLYVFELGDNFVRAWSVEHIPYEHLKKWVSEFRTELRGHLDRLNGKSDASFILNASYSSSVDVFFADVENRLFYNIGAKVYKNTAKLGIRFQKAGWKPNATFPEAKYLYEYSLIPQRELPLMSDQPALLSFDTHFLSFSHLSSWPTVWFGLKDTKVSPNWTRSTRTMQGFAVSATVTRPISHIQPVNLAGKVKAVIDGIVCALHSHQPSNDRALNVLLVKRLAGSISKVLGRTVDEDFVWKHLLDESTAVLGPTQLLRKRGDGYQCNPSDHLCLRGELLMETTEGSDWQLQVKVFEA